MSVLYVALPIALLLGGAGCIACLVCIYFGQYDDLEASSVRMLVDDPRLSDQATSDSSDTSSG